MITLFRGQRRRAITPEERDAIRVGEMIHAEIKSECKSVGLVCVLKIVAGEKSGFRRYDPKTKTLDQNFSSAIKSKLLKNKAALKIYAKYYDERGNFDEFAVPTSHYRRLIDSRKSSPVFGTVNKLNNNPEDAAVSCRN